jgi:cell division septation protein DedD
MEKIAKHITELLYYHDCVILPELGGFIANYRSANIDPQRKLIHPPGKNVLFNKHVKVNDGLLASKLVKEESISYDKAIKELTRFINRTKKQINSGERVVLDKVGVLYLDKENNIQFIQDSTNFLTSSFGLPSVDLIPVEKEVVKEVEKAADEPKIIPIGSTAKTEKRQEPTPIKKIHPSATKYKTPDTNQKKENEKRRSTAFWAAAVFIPLVLLYGVLASYNGLKDGNGFNTASLNPLSWFDAKDSVFENEQINATPEVVIPSLTDHQELNLKDEIKSVPEQIENINEEPAVTEELDPAIKNNSSPAVAIPESTFVEPEHKIKTDFRYHLIGGCFSKEKYASNFIADMIDEGFSAQELDVHNGLHRISLGGTNSRKEARQLRKKAKEQDISSWILKL